MKLFLSTLAAMCLIAALSACSTTNVCPGGYSNNTWCHENPGTSDD